MPIYAYKCESCGHRQDVLQKVSDPVLSVCPACGAASFAKQLTAAGFQLKGSGWYATDFRGGNTPGAADKDKEGKADKADAKPADAAAPAPTAGAAAASAPTPSPTKTGPPKSEAA